MINAKDNALINARLKSEYEATTESFLKVWAESFRESPPFRMNEFGIIDTYNSDNGVNVRDSMDANFDTDKESSSGNGDTDSDDMNDPEYSALLLEEDLLNDEINENNPYGYSDFPLSDENEVYGEISNRGYDGLDDNVIVNVGDSGDIDLDSVRATANGVMKEVIDNVILDSGNDSNESNSVDIDTSTSNSGDTVKEADDVKSDNEEVVVHDSAKPEEEKVDDLTLTFNSDDIFLGEKEPNIIKIDTARDITDSDFEVVSDIFPSTDSGTKDAQIMSPEVSSDVNVLNGQEASKEEADDFFSSTEKAILNDNLEEKKLPDMDDSLEGEDDIIIDEDEMTRLPEVGNIGSVKPTSSFRDIESKKSEIGNMEVPTNGIMDQSEEVFNSSEYIEK